MLPILPANVTQSDTKTKIMSHCVGAMKDANPKIVSVGMQCVSSLVSNYREDFSSLANMSFEALLLKLGDSKVLALVLTPY